MKTIALVTAAEARHLDEDLPPLEAALRALGVEPVVAAWDDPHVDWKSFPLAVIRSTWNYVTRRDEFLAWADRVASVSRLVNPPTILRWNTDKRYLRELGPSVVPTTFIEPSDPIDLPRGVDFVVKPAISAGSIDTARYSPRDAETARAHIRKLQSQRRTVMVQPYIGAIDEGGETALVYFAGAFSHAIRKGAMLKPQMELVEGLYFKEDIRPRDPSPVEREVADRIMSLAPRPLLYARVDLVPGAEGPLLLEFEATEPSLFFNHSKGAADRFARALVRDL
jgi:glutathione synthase/RimK-type ligase-like ATP-grasp enzyme